MSYSTVTAGAANDWRTFNPQTRFKPRIHVFQSLLMFCFSSSGPNLSVLIQKGAIDRFVEILEEFVSFEPELVDFGGKASVLLETVLRGLSRVAVTEIGVRAIFEAVSAVPSVKDALTRSLRPSTSEELLTSVCPLYLNLVENDASRARHFKSAVPLLASRLREKSLSSDARLEVSIALEGFSTANDPSTFKELRRAHVLDSLCLAIKDDEDHCECCAATLARLSHHGPSKVSVQKRLLMHALTKATIDALVRERAANAPYYSAPFRGEDKFRPPTLLDVPGGDKPTTARK